MRGGILGAAGVFWAAVSVLLLSSCASVTEKGYEGSLLPADVTATVESGPHTAIEKFDGILLGSSQLNVVVLPGTHTFEIVFTPRMTDTAFYYSNVTALLTFEAEADHRYGAVAYLLTPDSWVAYVVDRASGKRVAQSEELPLKVEWLYRNDPFR
jgi:hypothetical protein